VGLIDVYYANGADGLVVILDRPLKLTQIVVGVTSVVVGLGILGVEANGIGVLFYCIVVMSLIG